MPPPVIPPTAPPPIDGAGNYAALKSAVLGAQANTAPGASPLGSFPELAQLYSSDTQLGQTQLNNAAPFYNNGVQVENDRAAAASAASAARKKLEDLQDPSKYKQEQKDDGGYAFYDPLGQEISAAQYAAITNKSPSEILKNSQNPIDIAFREDYDQLQNYIKDKANARADGEAANRAKATESKINELYGIDLSQQSPQDVIESFKNAYPTVFGRHTTGPQGTSTLFPTKSSLDSSGSDIGS